MSHEQQMSFVPGASGLAKWQQAVFPEGTLHFCGTMNQELSVLVRQLSRGVVPGALRGSFAFFWRGLDYEIGAVDWFSSIPLFYSDRAIGPIYGAVAAQFADVQSDEKYDWELNFFRCLIVSNRTPDRRIRRLLPGQAWINGRITEYTSILEAQADRQLTPAELRETVEGILQRRTGGNKVLFVSGGTDSSALMAAISSAGLAENYKFVYVYSHRQLHAETAYVRQLSESLRLPIEVVDIGLVDPPDWGISLGRQELSLGVDRGFLARKIALKLMDLSDPTIVTGEVGDQLFGGEKVQSCMLWALQARSWSARDIGRLFVHYSMNQEEAVRETGYVHLLKGNPVAREVYDECVEVTAGLFARCKEKDFLNRVLNVSMLFRGPFITMPYSQGTADIFLPFLEWELVELCLRSYSIGKIYRKGRLKAVLFEAWKELLPEVIWRAPKNGPHVPLKRDFRI